VLRKEDNDWVKNVWSMKWRVPGHELDQRKLGEIVEKGRQAHELNKQDAIDRKIVPIGD